jgi:hypothetical protein
MSFELLYKSGVAIIFNFLTFLINNYHLFLINNRSTYMLLTVTNGFGGVPRAQPQPQLC